MSSNTPFSTLRKNRVYAPILFAVAILLLVFLARPLFVAYSDTQNQLQVTRSTLSEKEGEYQKILALEAQLHAGGSGATTELTQKIDTDFVESNILEAVMINDFTRSSALGSPQIVIQNISVDRGAKLPSGISRGSVNLSLTSSSVDTIVSYLTYLTTSTPYAFSLDTINLPLDTLQATTNTPIQLTVDLGVYYYR